MWLRLFPPVTTEQVDATDGLVQLQKIRLPTAFGSGSHGGVVAAEAIPADVAISPPVIASTAALATAERMFSFMHLPFCSLDRGDSLGRGFVSLPCHFSRTPSGLRKPGRELVLDCCQGLAW